MAERGLWQALAARRIGSPRRGPLEYQGKQLFARHGVAVPEGGPRDDRRRCRRRGGGIGYPVRGQGPGAIGGRGKAGGIKVAEDATRPAPTPRRSSAWTSGRRGPSRSMSSGSSRPRRSPPSTTPRSSSTARRRSCWRSSRGWAGWTSRRSPRTIPTRSSAATSTRGGLRAPTARPTRRRRRDRRGRPRQVAEMLVQLYEVAFNGGRDADRGQPADRHLRRAGRRARRQGHDRRQRPLPPRGPRRARRRRTEDPQERDGQGEGPHLREARRRHRHPRQRRRALHVHARRRRPGRRRAGQLPRRRRRLEGRGDRRRARGHHLRREGHGGPLQHLRRDHPLRRGRQGHHRGLEPDRPRRAAGRPPRRHQLRGGPAAAGRGRAPDLHHEKTMLGAAEQVVELAKERR